MATPIAHKGCTAGAKVHALTMLDLLLKPALVQQAWDYYRTVQTKDQKYIAAAAAAGQARHVPQREDHGASTASR